LWKHYFTVGFSGSVESSSDPNFGVNGAQVQVGYVYQNAIDFLFRLNQRKESVQAFGEVILGSLNWL
jgi:hypothetical protein